MTGGKTILLIGTTLAVFLAFAGGSCFADPDEYWPLFNRDLWNTGLADPTLGGIAFPIELWNMTTDNQIGSGSPVVADIDGDGTPDVGVTTANFAKTGGVYVFDKDGNQLWKYAPGDYGTYATPPVADIDGDGKLEMIFPSYGGTIVAVDDDGSEMWSLDTGSAGTRSVIADLAGDAALEVVAGAGGKTWMLGAIDGSELWHTDDRMLSDPVVADINGDGTTEILFSRSGKTVVALNAEDGSVAWSSTAMGQDAQNNITVLSDVSGDGKPDIAIGARDKKLYVFSGADGSKLWDYAVIGRSFSAAAADFNGDGFDDVVTTATKGDGVESYVYVLDVKNHVLLWQANIVGKKYYSAERSPSIADVDGDGTLDVLVAGLNQKLYALSGVDGSEIWSVATSDPSAGVPAVCDLDGDGMMEIIISAGAYVQVFTGLDVTVVYVDDNWVGSAYRTEVEPGKYFGGNAFATVEDGVAGVAGSTVNVAPGTYTPAAKITVDKVGLLLIGPQAGVDPRPSAGTTRLPGDPSTEAILDGGGMSTILYIDADDVVIEGLEIRNGSGDLVTSPSSTTQYRPVVRYNIIHDSSGDEGIQLKNVVGALIEYNHVYNTGGDGINIGYDSVGGTIQYNEVHDIYSPDAAIYVYGTPNVTIKGNLVYDVHNNDGIKLGSKNGDDAGEAGGLILQNTVHDTAQDGIAVYMSHVDVEGNEVYNSTSENGGIYLAWSITDISLIGNVVRDNTLDPRKWGNPAGILIGTAVDAANVAIHYNSITGNTPFGITNLTGVAVDASLNWWGDADGPSGEGIGAGDAVSADVIFSPWLGVDPDGDPGAAGVQLLEPLYIVVAPVGPEPTTENGNTGYLDMAIWGSNDVPGTDTIEVRHGTYDASEPITDGVNMISEIGSAAHTTLDGAVLINAANVLLGKLRQGFTITGPITVGAGIDASAVHINWNDILGVVTNEGENTLDATLNFWGEDGPDTVGLVAIHPILPQSSDTIIGYMDDHNLAPLDAIGLSHLLLGGMNLLRALSVVEMKDVLAGLTAEELEELFEEYGEVAVRRAASMSGGDYEEFVRLLVGFGEVAGGGGGYLGGGGGGTIGDSGLPAFVAGELVPLQLELLDPITGEIADDVIVTFTVCGTSSDGTPTIAAAGMMTFDGDLGAYVYEYDTAGLAPGVYDVYLGTSDGRSRHFQIEVTE
jgi:outer membrane protein assembly factor BamB